MSRTGAADPLRHRAEALLSLGQARGGLLDVDLRKLVHELQVHQVELEIQNEELRQAQGDSQAALEAYANLYDHAPVGYLTLDRNGTIHRLNLAAAELLRNERSRLIGRRLWQFVGDSDPSVLNNFLADVFASRIRQSGELAIQPPGYAQAPSVVQVEAVADVSGETCNVVLIDITARRAAERALETSEAQHRRAREEAEKACQAKSHFLAHTSHELCSSLTRMITLARQIADLLGGQLGLASTLDAGSTFSLYLPVTPAE